MSTLTSSSTFAQVEAEYDNNASYEEDASTSKARAFITALRILIRRVPEESRNAGSSVRYNIAQLREELAEARAWLAANDDAATDPDSGNRFFTFAEFR